MSTTLQADVAIVGTGPAGLSVARGLLGSGLSVLLLEAGGERPAGSAADRLGNVSVTGDDPYPQSSIDVTRGAALGGTATVWSFRMHVPVPGGAGADVPASEHGCRYAPLDAVDLARRDDIPHSGWPIGRADLDPWYAKAQEVAGLGPYAYATGPWESPDARPLDLAHGTIHSTMFQFGGASVWTRDALATLAADPKVRIVTGAVVTGVEADGDGGRVTGVRFVTADGGPGRVEARAVVLAAGGIENSRLLLLSDDVARGGLGNAHDQVGRYWMEHPLVRGGMLRADPHVGLARRLRLYDAHRHDGTLVMAKLGLTERAARAEGLGSTSVILLPRDAVLAAAGVRAYQTLSSPSSIAAGPKYRAGLAMRAGLGARELLRARRAIAGQPSVDDSGWSRQPGAEDVALFEMLHQTEQTPDPGNRVALGRGADAFGRRTAVLHWRWTEDDQRRVTRARDLYAEAFAASGYGRVVGGDWDAGRPRMVGGNHHHLGGTRMSVAPRDGVVDADCRVHGLANLFVAGSSVFPAGGSVNPTLTIVALALRLADHLRTSGLTGTARLAGSAEPAEPAGSAG